MKKLRNIKPGQRKRERKDATSELHAKAAAFLDHPKECCVCKTAFERTKETVKNWQVTVREDRVRLTCPECSSTIREVLEKINET